jgi:hypothetical protein
MLLSLYSNARIRIHNGRCNFEYYRSEQFGSRKLLQYCFDRLLPRVAGEKLWANKDKVVTTISHSGKILVTDEAFTKLCLLNYWERRTSNKSAQWTDAHGGNTHFKGWSNDTHLRFDKICRQINTQRESKESKVMEVGFLDYAMEQHSRGTKWTRSGIQEDKGGPELFNESS